MKLYTITMIDVRPPKDGTPPSFHDWHSAVICVCTTLAEAKDIVATNSMDICEGTTNDYAVIATVESDTPYGIVDGHEFEEHWHVWKGSWDDGHYHECEKPDLFRNIVFGL